MYAMGGSRNIESAACLAPSAGKCFLGLWPSVPLWHLCALGLRAWLFGLRVSWCRLGPQGYSLSCSVYVSEWF